MLKPLVAKGVIPPAPNPQAGELHQGVDENGAKARNKGKEEWGNEMLEVGDMCS